MEHLKLALVASALLEAIQASPNGIPSGPMYAMVMGLCSLEEYERIMAALVTHKKIRKGGNHQYFPVD